MMANPTMRRPLILIADAGHLGRTYSWRKGSCADADPFSIGAHVALARNAEAAGIDAVFQADFIGLNRANVRRDPKPPFESFQLAAVIAAMVPRTTVIPTASVLFSEPYTVARNLVSLDHIAAGRLAWNLVTSFHGERNFGYEAIPAPVDSYRRAGEFLNVVRELWHSWPQEANRPNVESGEFVDASQIQDIHHRGEFYSVAGAIDAAPLSRRLPLVLQAGASPDGIDSAIRGADAIFAAAPTLEHGERLVTKVRARAAELGRDPETLRFIFGMRGVIAGTAEAAQASVSQPLSETELAIARDGVEREIEGLRLDTLELDAPLPPALFEAASVEEAYRRRRSRIEILKSFATRPEQTLRGLLSTVARQGAHANVIGTAETVANEWTRWHERGVADGFILINGFDYEAFGSTIAPILRSRGVTEAADPQATLRERLHLS
jgi:FMN-dependent oxidoreductase (nitrilotriacetate monooxygenase family)